MVAFDELSRLLIPPESPVLTGTAAEWAAFEASLELRLPGDYRAFVETYGLGTPNDYFSVLNPFDQSLQSRQQWFQEVYAEVYSKPDYLEYLAEGLTAPVPRGLVAWATGDGGTVYWDPRSSAHPDQWTVVEEQEDYWQGWPLTMSEYIVKAMTGEICSLQYGPIPPELPAPFRPFMRPG
jgi:SMI1/KNR4 family protein SUKH-1